MTDPSPDTKTALANILAEIRMLVANEGNDFVWAGWIDRGDALAEITDAYEQALAGHPLPLEVLFAPTSAIQELSMSSGWSDEYLKIAEHFDAVIEAWPRVRQ